jgi:hypothetical protein
MLKWNFGITEEDFESQIEYSNSFHDDSLAKFTPSVDETIQCMAGKK